MIQYLMSLEGIEFNLTELAEEVGVSRPSATKSVKRFVEWGLVNARNKKNITYYSLNRESPIVETILKLDNLLIEKMLGDEVLFEIHDYLESKKPFVDTTNVVNLFKQEPKLSNCASSGQSLIKETRFGQEIVSFKHHKFYSNTEENPISKSSILVVTA